MARQVRIEYVGATYHVMARGNHGSPFYDDDRDRKMWLETLAEACETTGWRVHAYVLMGNHYHLLLETPEANLVAGMKWFQGAYTQRYNGRPRVFGHLFQGRYKAVVVDADEGNYFGVASTYIHLNPARAKLIRVGLEPLARYAWSSYPWYLRRAGKAPAWRVTERVMGSLGLGPREVAGYEACVEGRALELGIKAGRAELNEQWKMLRRGWYMGGEGFRGRLLKCVREALKRGRGGSYEGAAKRAHGEAEAERLIQAGMAALGVSASELAAAARGMLEKRVLAWWLRQRTTAGRSRVCARLCMGEVSAVTRANRAAGAGRDPKMERMKSRLAKIE